MPTDQSAGYNQDFDIEKKAQELLEETDSDSRIRIFDSKFAKLLAVGLIIWSLFQLYYNTIGVMSTIHFRAWHILFLLCFTFVYYPAFKKEKRKRKLPPVFDLALIALTIYVYTYVVINYDAIAQRGGNLNGADLLVAILGILLILKQLAAPVPAWLC